jgi:hypothetical protein
MIRRFAALALLCSAVACDSATDADPAAQYALVVNPPVVMENESVRIELLQDRLELNAGGSARREVTQRYDFVSPALRDTTESFVETYHYDVDGATIEMTALCPPNALCMEGPHLWGRVTADGLELHTHLDPDVVLPYRRLVP